MAIDAKGLVLMEKEEEILTKELGSYEIEEGLQLVYKAYVSNGIVNLFLTTDRDVTDDEYNAVYDEYNSENLTGMGYEVEEVEDEYNPVWCIKFEFLEDHMEMENKLNDIIGYHMDEINRIFEGL